MGSGVALKQAIVKYGIENFTKEILCECSSLEEMFAKEKEMVVISPLSYNLTEGGRGGFSHIIESGKNINYDWTEYRNSANYAESQRKGYEKGIGREGFIRPKFKGGEFKGKSHTEETKRIIGKKNSLNMLGSGNSQFGTMWITDGSSNLKIKKNDSIPEGFRKGRVI